MKRFAISFVVLVAFTGGIAAAQFAPPIPIPFRHKASDSFEVFKNDIALDGIKIVYVRDEQAPDACTQVLIIGTEFHVAPAHPDSCVF